jgi:hypothetical protein
VRLFHYTCEHCAPGIAADGVLRPRGNPLLREPLVWATDLDVPHTAALGLASSVSACDRTARRFEVTQPEQFVRWAVYARGLPRRVRMVVEDAEGVLPAHWWVSTTPAPVARPAVPAA